MAVDNPSYFSLAGGGGAGRDSSSGTDAVPCPPGSAAAAASGARPHSRGGLASLFRRRTEQKMGVGSSGSVVSASTTSTLTHLEGGSNRAGSTSGASTPSTPTEECALMPARNGQPSSCQRRSFRNLFRSVSTNTESERTRQFLKGDPRPSDVAPPSPYLPHRSHSHSENDRTRPTRGRVLESAGDMIHCGLPGGDAASDSEPNEEVFLGASDARYYNLSSTLPAVGSAAAGRRRHSIGTFLGKDRVCSSVATRRRNDPVLRAPDTMAPPIPSAVEATSVGQKEQTRRRRHRSVSRKGTRTPQTPSGAESTPDDVVFLSSKESEASTLWVNYLTRCFEQISQQQGRPPFKVHRVTVEESVLPGTEEKIGAARLQIVVVCPDLLERVPSRTGQAANPFRQLVPDRVLAMMLGVHDGHLTDNHRTALISYTRWRKFFVKDQDETSVGDFLGAAVAILGNAQAAAAKNDKTAFSVLPKKVKMGQNRVIALLNDPLRPEDNVSVVVDRCGEAIDVSHVKKRNPYTLQFCIPERCLEVSMLVGVRISKNGNPLGVRQVKCESRLRELDQILRAHDNPLEFMCQTFGFNPGDREQLDNWMVHAFQRNVPPHFNLLSTPAGMIPSHKNRTSPEENPTLLHFAARFGLEKLAWQLLECPGGDLACDLRNVAEMTPADLADLAGHSKLAHQLRGYMQMNEFTNMYSYLKVMSETTSSPVPGTEPPNTENQEQYCRPRPLSEAYSVPPAARPLTTMASQLSPPNLLDANYSIAPTPTPVILPSLPTVNANGLDLPLQGYLEMHPASLRTPEDSTAPSRLGTPTLSGDRRLEHSASIERVREENSSTPTSTSASSVKSSAPKLREPSGPQDELLEIINDFKNNVFTISEVERLVENWRNRNDVQQSFKDKQRQLMAMREEYDRIQKKLKDEMKVPTPFDRIRKFFSKGKKEGKDSANGENSLPTTKTDTATGALSDHRPVSSLSLHSVSSSSSSGRMSTVSGCSGTSLGDSGTHSDPEDKKLPNAREDKGGMMSYEIPPAPKPFTGRYSPVRYAPSPTRIPEILDLRTSQQARKPGDNGYYIAFPPSGLPIHSFKADGTAREPKTPSSPTEQQPDYLDLTDTVDGSTMKNSYANVNPAPSSPLSQLPRQAPPGMCIPTEYMNVSPSTTSSTSQSFCPVRSTVDQQSDRSVQPISEQVPTTRRTDRSSSSSEESSSNAIDAKNDARETVPQTSEEYVQSDVINDNSGDVPDTSSLPEYVNVTAPSSQDVSAAPKSSKKLPAPPVPPRAPSKK